MGYKVLLLNSGGADSLCTASLLDKTGYTDIYSLFIDYGQPNAEAEWESVQWGMADLLDGETTGKLFNAKIELASQFEENAHDSNQQEIFLRNFVFMSYASQLAYSMNIQNIATGYAFMQEAVDYVDDNPVFLQNFHKTINQAFGMRLLTPIAGWDKDMIYTHLLNEGIDPETLPYCNTPVVSRVHSGDKMSVEPCGKCHKCIFTKTYLTALKEERNNA